MCNWTKRIDRKGAVLVYCRLRKKRRGGRGARLPNEIRRELLILATPSSACIETELLEIGHE
jgi:hypothetical protein